MDTEVLSILNNKNKLDDKIKELKQILKNEEIKHLTEKEQMHKFRKLFERQINHFQRNFDDNIALKNAMTVLQID